MSERIIRLSDSRMQRAKRSERVSWFGAERSEATA
jgi:hypothetical protein